MHVIASFTVVPIGVGTSLSGYVAACERVLQDSDLSFELHANGTNIEGDWDEVFRAVKRCHEAVHAMGAPRIFTTMQFGTRTDRQQAMGDKVRSVRNVLDEDGS